MGQGYRGSITIVLSAYKNSFLFTKVFPSMHFKQLLDKLGVFNPKFEGMFSMLFLYLKIISNQHLQHKSGTIACSKRASAAAFLRYFILRLFRHSEVYLCFNNIKGVQPSYINGPDQFNRISQDCTQSQLYLTFMFVI